jgi:hypothetical protein
VLSVAQKLFRISWRSVNLLLLISAMVVVYAGSWEYSVRRYLDGFADAIVPAGVTPEKRAQAILDWMRDGPLRSEELTPTGLAIRDPENTLNYQSLLLVCGTATNAFLNLARSANLQARRLLLLTPDRTAMHVVAEVQLNGRWAVIDPQYRVILRNAAGEMVTRSDLKDPRIFSEVIGKVPGYPAAYNYQNFAHVRLARLPLEGLELRPVLDRIFPGWEEKFDWSLLLERESFFVLIVSACFTFLLCILRLLLGWYADRKMKIPRFHLREHLARAGSAFFTTPEIK